MKGRNPSRANRSGGSVFDEPPKIHRGYSTRHDSSLKANQATK
uniref:Uncharacterized protein n=1 Tax=Lotus japonicus TaxID=34305 RepID=I3T0L5_LOTJA|nr:unknown [Lotus japonicus]